MHPVTAQALGSISKIGTLAPLTLHVKHTVFIRFVITIHANAPTRAITRHTRAPVVVNGAASYTPNPTAAYRILRPPPDVIDPPNLTR